MNQNPQTCFSTVEQPAKPQLCSSFSKGPAGNNRCDTGPVRTSWIDTQNTEYFCLNIQTHGTMGQVNNRPQN